MRYIPAWLIDSINICCRRNVSALAVGGCAMALILAGGCSHQSPDRTAAAKAVTEQQLSAHSYEQHHYASPAQRAEDALLIVKVKATIADAGLADNSPLTVDADHGRITLAGVLDSRQDVDRAVALVAGIDGVTAVNNRLTWEKRP